MQDVWSEDNKLQKMLDVELAVCEVLSKKVLYPKAISKLSRRRLALMQPRLKSWRR